MKRILFCFIIFILLIACTSPKKGTTGAVTEGKTFIKDSIEYYETDYDTRQSSNIKWLAGSWNIDTMRQQARMNPEAFTNTYLIINADSTFTGNAGCNRISGKYSLKGMSVRFNSIIATKMACPQLQQENAFLRLLQETVSAYTVGEQKLLLRDGSGNIVFSASRKAN